MKSIQDQIAKGQLSDFDPGQWSNELIESSQTVKSLLEQSRRRIALGYASETTLETVIETDDRTEIEITLPAPWRMVCQLIVATQGGGRGVGTGWLAGPQTVVTAAHNIDHPDHGKAASIRVCPGYDGDSETNVMPFGMQTSTRFDVLPEWRTDQTDLYDIGVIHLDKPFEPHPGHFAFGVLEDAALSGRWANIAGYPYALKAPHPKDPKGELMYHHRHVITDVDDKRVRYLIDTSAGNSGSPLWVQDARSGAPLVVGIHARGFTALADKNDQVNWAPRINAERFEIIQSWIEQSAAPANV